MWTNFCTLQLLTNIRNLCNFMKLSFSTLRFHNLSKLSYRFSINCITGYGKCPPDPPRRKPDFSLITNTPILLLQKQHHHVDIQVSHTRPLIGGHLQPTTFRPPKVFALFNRRSDSIVSNTNQGHAAEVLPHPNSIQSTIQPGFEQKPQQHFQQQIIAPQQQFVQPQQQFVQPQLLQAQPFSYHPFGQVQQQPQQQHFPQQQSVILQSSQQPQYVGFNHQGGPRFPFLNQQQQHQVAQQGIFSNQQPNLNQRQYEEQLAYNQYLQANKLQEEQLRQQLSRQYNRFNLPSNNQQAYVPLG